MSEQDPSIRINLGEEKFEMTRDNSSLYTFLGRAAIFNHIYLIRDEVPVDEEGNRTVTYLFRSLLSDPSVYDKLMELMTENQFPMQLNRKDVMEVDVDAYTRMVGLQIPDEVPSDWETER